MSETSFEFLNQPHPCTSPKESLVINGNPYQTINGKPYFALGVMAILSVLFLVFPVGKSWVLGLLLGAFTLFVFILCKSYTQFALYPDFMLIYDYYKQDEVTKIEWKDIKEWTIDNQKGTNQILKIMLKSTPQVLSVPLLAATPIYKAIKKQVPEKESCVIRKKDMDKRIDENHSQFSLFSFNFLKKKKK
jgi:hypothetical protein